MFKNAIQRDRLEFPESDFCFLSVNGSRIGPLAGAFFISRRTNLLFDLLDYDNLPSDFLKFKAGRTAPAVHSCKTLDIRCKSNLSVIASFKIQDEIVGLDAFYQSLLKNP